MQPHPNPGAPSSKLAGLQHASPHLTPARSRPPPEVAGGPRHPLGESLPALRRKARVAARRRPSARLAPQGPTRRQSLFRPTAPAVTVAASALQTPVTPHKNNNLLAGVRSGEAVAGAAQHGTLGLEVPPASPASSRREERTTTPEDSYSPQP